MRIKSIEVIGFKSLVKLKLDLPKFCCLTGLNGSGKSTVLQFIDFAAQQVRGEIADWLRLRGWKNRDVLSKLTSTKEITFHITLEQSNNHDLRWTATFDPHRLMCVSETIQPTDTTAGQAADSPILQVANGRYRLSKRDEQAIEFNYQGSILSGLLDDKLPSALREVKTFLSTTESLDMLTPERLRERVREARGTLGIGGRNLSAFLADAAAPNIADLTKTLRRAYPQLINITVRSLRAGWKQLQVTEKFGEKAISTEAQHINDGTLRLLAIFAELASKHGFLVFDEIENGINPELIEMVVKSLSIAPQQVLLTTHSPMILNYLDDQQAKESVIFLYRTKNGFTQAKRLFEIPSLSEKLKVMGPGEAFADTDLQRLSEEITAIPHGED